MRIIASFFALFSVLPLPALAQGIDASPDGVWRGQVTCSEGVGAASALKATTAAMNLRVTSSKGVSVTDNIELTEQVELLFSSKTEGRIEVSGVRKNVPDRTWRVRAEGRVVNGRFHAEGPMYRADGVTLVRQACVFDLQQLPTDGRPLGAVRPDPEPAPVKAPTIGIHPDEDAIRLMLEGTQDPKRLKDLIDFLLAIDASQRNRNNRELSKDAYDALSAEEARVSLAVLNSLGALGLHIYLDKQHPAFKRDLAGAATLGDGRLPVRVLLLDARTRARTLVDSAATTLLIGTEPAKLQQGDREVITRGGMISRDNPVRAQDQRLYLAQIAQKLQEVLAAKGIKVASIPKVNATATDLSISISGWTDGGQSGGLQEIGRDFPIVIAFDAQLKPAQGVETVLWRTSEIANPNNRERAAFAESVQSLQKRLNDPRFEKLATLAPRDLSSARTQQLEAARNENDRLRQEMVGRIEQIKNAINQKTELVGVLRIYRKGKPFSGKPESAFCTVKADDAVVLLGLVNSPSFLSWTKLPKGTRFSKVYDSADDLYGAINEDKCNIVADNANNLNKILTAVGRDGQFVFNVGPLMDRDEGRESFAISLGFDSYTDYEFGQKIGGASPVQIRNLKEFGAGTLSAFKIAVARMNTGKYNTDTAPSAPTVLEFLDDEVKGKKVGKSALDFRRAEEKRLAEETKLREEQVARERAERAKSFPYVAILTCGMGKEHINVLACFAAQGSSSVDTELVVNNGDSTNMYKAYTLSSAGQERRDGFYIDLRKSFSIRAQNSHGTLILGLKIIDRVSGKVLFEKQAARFDVLTFAN